MSIKTKIAIRQHFQLLRKRRDMTSREIEYNVIYGMLISLHYEGVYTDDQYRRILDIARQFCFFGKYSHKMTDELMQ